MSELIYRPRRLTYAVTFIVLASTVLSANEKLVWYQIWALDGCRCKTGEECWCKARKDGCYMSLNSFSARTGLSPRTVEDCRTTLQQLGMVGTFPRPEGRDKGRLALLPITLPAGEVLTIKSAAGYGPLLDVYLVGRQAWLRRRAESGYVRQRSTATSTHVPETGTG